MGELLDPTMKPLEQMTPAELRSQGMKFIQSIVAGNPRGIQDLTIPNPARSYDESGRLVRWKLDLGIPKRQKAKLSCCEDEEIANRRKLKDRLFVRKLELYNESMHSKLE